MWSVAKSVTGMNSNNKRIAKNSIFLYIRMLVTIIIGLFTSRIVLQTLGISDYGIFSLVGGIIMMLTSLNAAMMGATQRFLSFELGRGETEKLKAVFSTAISVHLLIALFVFVIGETVGLWYVNTHLVIPAERMVAANWVYQASIATFILNIISCPYNAVITAREHMNAFAYISILEYVLKLVIVYALLYIHYDKLIVYGLLTVLVAVVIRLCYSVYCTHHFPECKTKIGFDKPLFREMSSFAGWTIVGHGGITLRDQCINIIVNLFFGTVLNAARGLAVQVSNMITSFSQNIVVAVSPQIIKEYAAGNMRRFTSLIMTGCRLMFYMLAIISLPVFINIDYVLQLWLGTVPEYTGTFIRLILIACMIYSLSACVTLGIQATGNIKIFQIGVNILTLSDLPMAYLLLYLGYPPYAVVWPTILTNFLALMYRIWVLKRYVSSVSMMQYTISVVIRCTVTFALSSVVCHYILLGVTTDNIFTFIWTSLIAVLVNVAFISLLGLTKTEKEMIANIWLKKARKFISIH